MVSTPAMLAYGKPIWDVLAERPKQCETFQNAMTASAAIAAWAIVKAYDFSGIRRLADVGGGHGLLLASVLGSYPNMQGVLFDRPEVIASVPGERFAAFEDRVTLEMGSFFERVPDGCDAYLIRRLCAKQNGRLQPLPSGRRLRSSMNNSRSGRPR